MHLPAEITDALTDPGLAVRLPSITQEAWLYAKEMAGTPIGPDQLSRLEALGAPAPVAWTVEGKPAPAPQPPRRFGLELLDRLLRRPAPAPRALPLPSDRLTPVQLAERRRRNRLCEIMGRTAPRPGNGGDAA